MRVSATPSAAQWLSTSSGVAVSGTRAELHRGDVRPTGDLVVEVAPAVVHPNTARAYVASAGGTEDPYVLVRTEVPQVTEAGITLAIVVDSSFSAGASSLETERAVVDALLEGLGPRDSLVVLASDQTVRAVGPEKPTSVTPELRDTVRRELASIHAGGASNVALALERAADLLDEQGAGKVAAGMVVYLGDGRPSIGETTARDLRRRLGRRPGGVPRMGAVSVGFGADKWLLAQLVAGSGPVYEAVDRVDAAKIGAQIVADALQPTLRAVEIDLGPTIDRIYPRESSAALAGSTVTVTGRLRGKLPRSVNLRFRRGGEMVEESRPLDLVSTPSGADVRQRWAMARVEDIAARGEGIEPAIAIANESASSRRGRSWFYRRNSREDRYRSIYVCSASRPRSTRRSPPRCPPSVRPPRCCSSRRRISEATRPSKALPSQPLDAPSTRPSPRSKRAAMRAPPSAPTSRERSTLDLSIGTRAAGPRARRPRLGGRPAGRRSDPRSLRPQRRRRRHHVLPRGGEGARRELRRHAPARAHAAKDAVLGGLHGAAPRSPWNLARLRLQGRHLDYVTAARACELPTWTDRRALLELLIGATSSTEGLTLARTLDLAGEKDAAAFVRQEILRRVSNASELAAVSRALIGSEPAIDKELEKAYAKAKSDDERLVAVRRFLRLAPHDALARRRLFALLETLGRRDALVEEITRARADPFADAGLLAAGASALRRLGFDAEGRRAFGELIERAPGDPWPLAYVGDRLRGEGLFDDAVSVYERLDAMMPEDPAVALRLALAHAGAGRLDVATRLLDRAAQTGGRSDDGRLGELASITEAMLLASSRATAPPDTAELLLRRLSRTPLPDVAGLVVVRSQPGDDPVVVRIARGDKDRDGDPADLDAPSIGLSAVRLERGGGVARIRLRRSTGPGRATQATVTALVLGDDRRATTVVSRDVVIAPGGDGVELRWNGEAWL